MEFAIVDIETTGGAPTGGGITEIAVVIHDGQKICEEYQTLLNPGHAVPAYITGLTGIDNQMVENAPTFESIAEELWQLLDGRVFVAHSVNFDYGFLRAAFSKVGRTLDVSKLCTVRLSRRAFPGQSSYSLGRICEVQRIPILARHRAMGDAKATAILFDRILVQSPETVYSALKKKSGEAFLPSNIPIHKFREIPKACGVYYMLNEKGKIIYVGKAVDIRERFKGHFSGKVLPQFKQQLKDEIADFKWQLTGSEFLALLIETLEIKKWWPKYNSAMKLPKILWGLFHYQDHSGYERFQVSKVTKQVRPLETFFSRDEAIQFLKEAISAYGLCQRLCGLRQVSCEAVGDVNCQGACHSGESPSSYNSRVGKMIDLMKRSRKELLITLDGRNVGEKAAVLFEGGVLSKYGFFTGEEVLLQELEVVPRIPETFYILKQFIYTLDPDQIKVLEDNTSGI